jgi:2-oxoglutarate ferredoxin oxidoreductase subunit alpha
VIVLAPASVQEMADFVEISFDLAFKYRTPVIILSDGIIGQMMEKVMLPPFKARKTAEEIATLYPWAATGRDMKRKNNIFTSLDLDQERHERHNIHLQQKYATIKEEEVRYEEIMTEDAEYLLVAFGSAARIAQKAIEDCRKEGIKVGLLRPVTLWPFPTKRVAELAGQVKGILCAEINAGQMVQDIRLAVEGKTPVSHYGRMGGMVPTPEEIAEVIRKQLVQE